MNKERKAELEKLLAGMPEPLQGLFRQYGVITTGKAMHVYLPARVAGEFFSEEFNKAATELIPYTLSGIFYRLHDGAVEPCFSPRFIAEVMQKLTAKKKAILKASKEAAS